MLKNPRPINDADEAETQRVAARRFLEILAARLATKLKLSEDPEADGASPSSLPSKNNRLVE